jgi:hypothetical protein
MRPKLNLLCSTALRSIQVLFALVVIGLSATLVAKHNGGVKSMSDVNKQFSGVPMVLVMATITGVLSLVAAMFNLFIAWTDMLREYIEILVDLIVMVGNVVCGTVRIRKSSTCVLSLANRLLGHFP